MTTTRTARCSCGQLSISCSGEPFRVSICHCLACQRRTGSVFGAQARFREEQIDTVSGISRVYERVADSGNVVRFHFCPKCGGTVHYAIDDTPGVIAVPVGNFADPGFPQPRFSVYEARRHGWVQIPQDCDHLP